MLKNCLNSNIYNSAKNLNSYLPITRNNKSKKNYKFNDLNPVHSEKKYIGNKTRNYKTPDRQYNKSKNISNSCMNLKLVNIPNSSRNPTKSESIFSSQINSNILLNSVRYVSSPILIEKNKTKISSYKKPINTYNKKTLILDLDETLVHSAFYPFEKKSDIILRINIDGRNHIIHVLKRPNLDLFLKKISELFNIVIFTASIPQYAEPLIDILDPDKKYKRMYRENCVKKNGFYLKDLSQIGNYYQDMIIIDNNPISYSINQDNGLPILTWYDDMNDNELMKLIPLLEFLSKVNDVRPIINQIVDKDKNEIDFKLVKKIIFNNDNENNENLEINASYNNSNIIAENINSNKLQNLNNNENIDINIQKNLYNNYIYNGKDKISFNLKNKKNKMYYSLSNMSYDEIQNEGYTKKSKINNNNSGNNISIFNSYRNFSYKNKNKINLFMKTKEIFNISAHNENGLNMDNGVGLLINNKKNKTQNDKIEKIDINKNNNYNFNYGQRKNISVYEKNQSYKDIKDINNCIMKENYEINKNSITIYYQEQTKLNKILDCSFNGNNKLNTKKKSEKFINNINKSYSMTKEKKIKNYNLPNDIFSQNKQLYKKPINIKENNNRGYNLFDVKHIIDNNHINGENIEKNNFKSNIELRRERLEEMKRKIEEINKDIKETEHFYETQKKMKIENKDNIKDYDELRHKSNGINITPDENFNIMNINNDIKSYKVQVLDTDISKNSKHYNVFNKKEILSNQKNHDYSNINIYRNSKIINLYDHKNKTTCLGNKYGKKMEKDFYFQTPNLKKGKVNIFKNHPNFTKNKPNGQINNNYK